MPLVREEGPAQHTPETRKLSGSPTTETREKVRGGEHEEYKEHV